jgi:hypothetical protein
MPSSTSLTPAHCRVLPGAFAPSTLSPSIAHNTIILPEPVPQSTLHRPWAHNIVDRVLSPGLQHHQPPHARDTIDPTPSPSTCHPRAHNDTWYIFLYYFGPTNLEFDMLHYHIALICYTLLHCFCSDVLLGYATLTHYFDMLHCHIALICYTLLQCFCSTILLKIFLHRHIALICYIATLLWYAIHCYIAQNIPTLSHCFDILHCFDMLHIAHLNVDMFHAFNVEISIAWYY